jgi:hypothetical protein
MSIFSEFERKVVTTLICGHMNADQVTTVLDTASLVSYDHTGVGYFLTVQHPSLPSKRTVYDKPLLIGISGDVECGFVIFIEDSQLTLECHNWGLGEIPKDFRKKSVEIKLGSDQ